MLGAPDAVLLLAATRAERLDVVVSVAAHAPRRTAASAGVVCVRRVSLCPLSRGAAVRSGSLATELFETVSGCDRPRATRSVPVVCVAMPTSRAGL